MATPVIESTANTNIYTAATSHTVNLPSGIADGDGVFIALSTDDGPTVSWPAGWTELYEETTSGSLTASGAYRDCDGTEGSTITVTTGTSEPLVARAYRFSGVDFGTRPPEAAHVEPETSYNPDPPSLTPSYGSDDYLWLAIYACEKWYDEPSVYPSGYSNTGYQVSSSSGVQVLIAYATKDTTAATSENPGTFTKEFNFPYTVSSTIAIPSEGSSGYTLTADPGTFTVSGQTADLLNNKTVSADPGAFTLTGQSADLLFGRTLGADPATFTINGQSADLLKASTLSADAATITINGQDASLNFGIRLPADAGTFTISGQDASLHHDKIVGADSGTFTINGQDAALNYSGSGSKTLTADPGTFTISGQVATLEHDKILGASGASFTISGQNATLKKGFTLSADPGAFVVTGQNAGLVHIKTMTASPGTFAISGQDASLQYGYRLTADAGSISISGQDAGFDRTYVLSAASGTVTINGQDASLTWSGAPTFDDITGEITFTSVTMKHSYTTMTPKITFA